METTQAIVDPIHIFNDKAFIVKDIIIQGKIHVVRKENSSQFYFRIQKGSSFISNTEYSFFNICEKSFELVHPSILNLSGFSKEKPYLYYKYISDWHKVDDIVLSYVNLQKIFLGIASGLSYLLKKGYYYDDFSISSVIFDKNFCPKLFNYINFDASNKNFEKDLIPKYADLVINLINEQKKENSQITVNPELQKLIDGCKQTKNLPNFNEFINFFEREDYCLNENIVGQGSFIEYLNVFYYTDKIIYDGNRYPSDSIEQMSCYFLGNFYNWRIKLYYCYLNSFPEYYIKSLTNVFKPLTKKLHKFVLYEDLSLIIPDWQTLLHINDDQNPFKIYKRLKKMMKELENQKLEKIYLINERKEIENKINALRIQAINFLKKSYKKSTDPKISIELALQYIAGDILPYNLDKALKILKKIVKADEKTIKLINQMKTKIEFTIESSSVNNISQKLGKEQKEIFRKANEEDDIFSLLFCGFAFYTGFNEFPIMHELSVQYYRKAAKKSAYAMTILGMLYYKGVIFPQNLNRANNCFKKAADGGDEKAEIIDCCFRRHLWRIYLFGFNRNIILNNYLPSFKSAITNNSFIIPKAIKMNEGNTNYMHLFDIELIKDKEKSHSERYFENMNVYLEIKDEKIYEPSHKIYYSQKILLSSDFNESTKDREQQMHYGKSYFYGDNGFPVDYYKAAKYFKLAADNCKLSDKGKLIDNGDSEAQWRYALMCISIGVKDSYNDVETYLQKSAKQNNLKGKLLYALYLRANGDNYIFEQLIQECCDSGDPDAMYYYALHLEKIDKSLDQSMYFYQKAVDKGHFYSLIRLIYIYKYRSQTELYRSNLILSVALMNEPLLIRLICFYDKIKKYDQSNILIQFGLKLNYKLFNSFYADHLLYGKGIKTDLKHAEKLVILAQKDGYQSRYWERYIYIMLEIYIRRDQHQKAAEFLLCHGSNLTERLRRKFILFYRKFDKIIASRNLITINYCSSDYRDCQDELLRLKKEEKVNLPKVLSEIRDYAFTQNNPYAYVILGRMYKQGKHVVRDLKKAVQFFARAANLKCQEGYYYLGKEYFYGRILNQDYDLAKENFLLAMKNYGEPRAGYFIYKIPGIREDDNVDDVELLKISAFFGYKRALYKYGRLLIVGKDDRIKTNVKAGKEYIRLSALQNYKKAKRFLKLESFHFHKNDESDDSIDSLSRLRNNKIELKISIDEDVSFSDSETDDENIAKLINAIKAKKKPQNESNNNDNDNENNSELNRDKIYDIIAELEEENRNSLQNDTNEKSSESKNDIKNDENFYVSNLFMDLDVNENNTDSNNDKNEISSNLSTLLKDKKSSHKIDAKEGNTSSNIRSFRKNKMSSKKIIVEKDDDNDDDSNFSSFNKDKKSSNKIPAKEDQSISAKDDDDKLSSVRNDKKNSKFGSARNDKKKYEVSTDEDEEDISDLINFWT